MTMHSHYAVFMPDRSWNVIAHLEEMVKRKQACALLTVVGMEDPHSRLLGAKLCMDADGLLLGHLHLSQVTLGVLQDQVREVLNTRKARIFRWIPAEHATAFPADEPCTFFIEPVEHLSESWILALQHLQQRTPCLVATELDAHPRHDLLSEHDMVLPADRTGMLISGVFVERWEPTIRMVTPPSFLSMPLLRLAQQTGLQVELLDPESWPELDPFTALILVLESEHDLMSLLGTGLQTSVGYVGVVCSNWQARQLKQALMQQNLPHIERVFAPAGLNLGVQSPEGLAASVLCEILAVFHRQDPHSLGRASSDWEEPFR